MKLIVQIPCLNEEGTLPATLKEIPRQIDGIDEIEILVIDDGSTDRTREVARAHHVDHIIGFRKNRGLGHAFAAGIRHSLRLGADIIINTDGDNQYYGGDIPKLVQPILAGEADMVIGDRQTDKIEHFSKTKRRLQSFGSRLISRMAHVAVNDVASGFRAYTRESVQLLTCSTDFDHTVDHVIQAGRLGLAIANVPVKTNEKLRESRLFPNIGVFVFRSAEIAIRVYSSYRAFRVFASLGLFTMFLGLLLGLRFVYIFIFVPESSQFHVQSLILSAILLLGGLQMVLTGVVADLINSNRARIETLAAGYPLDIDEERLSDTGNHPPSGKHE